MKCKKIKLIDGTILLGILEMQDAFVKIVTGRREHLIQREQIVHIADTTIEFEEEEDNGKQNRNNTYNYI